MFIDSFGARWQDPPPPRYRAAVLGINLTNALLNPHPNPDEDGGPATRAI
ncbi:hypothetical protein [Streptomyces sp. IBSBF 3010]